MLKNTFIKRKKETRGHHHDPLLFPSQFLWGAATSSHQVEGNNTNNDWWEWEKKRFPNKKEFHSGRATGHYTRFKEDFALAHELGHNAHRFSIEWSRVEPKQGVWDEKEIAHYRDVLTSLKELHITTMVTLHHFTNPQWFSAMGGWLHPQSSHLFACYALKMEQELGDMVDFWVTINEPMIYVSNGFVVGTWPPQKKSFLKARRVLINMVKGHKRAWYAIQNYRKTDGNHHAAIGIAQNVFDFHTYNPYNTLNYIALRFLHWLVNIRFLDKIKHHMNFIGVNYYFHTRIRRSSEGFFKLETIDIRTENREASDMNWEIYPQGIFEALMSLKKYNLPLYVTENGIATVNDHKRIRFLVAHIKEVYHAIQAGAPVRGYFFWALMDNFEWDKGFWPRFGLLDIDYKTLKRTARPSALVYKKICQENGIAHDLLKFLGHGVHWDEDRQEPML